MNAKRTEKQTKARLYKKAAESAETISGMKRNQNILNDVVAAFSQVVSR